VEDVSDEQLAADGADLAQRLANELGEPTEFDGAVFRPRKT